MNLNQLVEHKVTRAMVLPGRATWLTDGKTDTTLSSGRLEGGKPQAVTLGGKKAFDYSVVGMHGIDAVTAVMTDGVWVTRLSLEQGKKAFKPVKRWRLPGEMGWRAQLTSSPDGAMIAAVSDGRLGVFGAHEKVISVPGAFAEHFLCVGVLPGAQRVVVGRGDGRVELRDAQTLELLQTFTVLKAAVLHLCVLDEHTVAVGDDMAHTGLIDLTSGAFTELEVGRMKTSGLHRLPDGRLVVVGLSRRVSIFSGSTRVAEVDLSKELGDRYVQGSAVDGDTLLLACEERGLYSLRLSELPAEAAPLDLPRPAADIRADATAVVAFARFMEAMAAKEDVSGLIEPLLQSNDEDLLRGVFGAFVRQGTPVPNSPKHLRSPHERVRFYAADLYGQLPTQYAGRAAELEAVINDPSPQVIAAALWAVGRLGDQSATPLLLPALGHAEQWVRNTAAAALVGLKTGKAELVAAMRAGAGDLSLGAIGKLWPMLSPALLADLSPEQTTRFSAGVALKALLDELQVDASPAFLEPLAAQSFAVPAPRRVMDVVWRLALTNRWAATFADERLRLVTPAEAADWWDAELARHFAAN